MAPTPARPTAAYQEARFVVAELRKGAARRSRFVPVCAIAALLSGAGACLNPIPDDFPNQAERDDDDDVLVGPGSAGGSASPGEVGSGASQDEDTVGPPSSPAPEQPGAIVPNAPDAGEAADAGAAQPRSDTREQDASDAGACSEAQP
jgi:hypothetical protein